MSDNTTIGWLGLGKMGTPICKRILATGQRLAVYDIDQQAYPAFETDGATPYADAGAMAGDVDVLMSMLPDDRALDAVAVAQEGPLHQLAEGGIFVDLSTVSPEASARVKTVCAERGLHYLRAPVSGSTALAKDGKLTVLVSGPRSAYDRVLPVFEAFSANQHYVGDDEQARYLKLVINHLVGSTAVILGEALTLGRAGGIDWDIMLDVLGVSVAASPLVKYKLEPLRNRDFTPAFSVSQMVKDMGLVEAAADSLNASMPAASLMAERFRSYAEVAPDQDFFGILLDIERKASLGPLPERDSTKS
ncbi:NAD(P)-dependent oxidoreductase [Salinisphaera sp.]|uniref:NAD(P)-dependent oxidoreductase n=1 Tax=Salinisphaera sp. TaxID=1914330 RepID=UPI002D77B876|nr:NAD(P)-dependent oxidoreductase [Salinisphaera sp.]HET7315762.1 NAD(P)-dependent oxidoreductase [Salinisphaera sp.]